MAHDGFWIRNKISGESICIAKRYEGSWILSTRDNFVDELREFFNEHQDNTIKESHAYEIVFECEPNNKKKLGE